jgi:hypothetical protein
VIILEEAASAWRLFHLREAALAAWPHAKAAKVCLTKEDHDWLDELTPRRAYRFAADQGYDLGDYVNGEIVSDWWGFVWMILAEKRGLLTHEQQALAWKKHDERLLSRENVVGVIRKECK